MKISLGKIFLIVLIPFLLNAKVTLNAPKVFFKGEPVVFSITVEGGNIQFPDIKNIEGFSVQSAGQSSQTRIVNGMRSESLTKSFVFRPARGVTIPSFKITVDGNVEKTKEHILKVKSVEKTNSKYYSLDIRTNKKSAYVGEAVKFTLKFRYRKDLSLVDLQYTQPTFENFWVKELNPTKDKNPSNRYVEQELHYLLFPQKSGKITIDPLKIGVVVMDGRSRGYGGFFSTPNTKTIPVYSNKLELDIKPLPNNVKLIGGFDIDAQVDKTDIKEGESVSLKVVINGRGNLDDIDEIKFNIPNATIYDNPSKKEYNLQNGVYGGKYEKTYSIVSSNDFTIPSVQLRYFDKSSNSVKTISTKPYHIKVKGQKKAAQPKLQVSDDPSSVQVKEKVVTKVVHTSDNQKMIYFVLGALGGLLTSLVIYLLKNNGRKKEELPIEKSIKGAKTSQDLLKLMVVYINIDEELDKIIFNLEKGIEPKELKGVKKQITVLIKDKKLDI